MNKIVRRTMLKTLGLTSLGSLFPVVGQANNSKRDSNKNIQSIKTDILVVGGGTAGVIAAIQAGRAGCSTILIENGNQLGGTTTTGGVAFPGLFHAWGKQIIAGIGWELVTDAVKLDGGELPDFSIPTGKNHPKHQVRINPNIYALLAEEKCLEASVQLRYYESPVKAEFKGNNWEVESIGKGTHKKIICKQLIDCTGNAFVTSLIGYNVLREKEVQPGSLMFRIGGYDLEVLDKKIIREKYNEAVKEGRLVKEEFRNNIEGLLRSAGDNIHHIAGANSTTSETHSLTNIKSRSTLLETLRFLRELPGCENTRLIFMQPETGIRETYRIDGEYKITHDDYISGKVFDDALCYSFYPIDVHDKHGVEPKHLLEGVVPTIPLRALIPKNSQNLLVAGRCVSSDRLANSALRVQASCMAMGQVAGATAALAVQQETTPLNVSLKGIRTMLVDNGAMVPNIND
ncbi:FAD-dependent oxidoreductase [Prolixibacteraceae bacterium Z1-6]|uniref:FAD-dependent oxidoreductase n=1 Tax=Draconibacterium aestuarii TaxID=2998507 RepID=A0A9X3FAD7_9BACT|nr:FAD-dependent oxidoreductase [Prolixibacteraceae bacterium Z1-6]